MNIEMRQRFVTLLMRGLLFCLLGSFAMTAAAITEVEPNDSISSAQAIAVPAGGLTIVGAVGDAAGGPTIDVDVFKFDATQGDTPSIATVGALMPDAAGACAGFASIITLYDSSLNLIAEGVADCASLMEATINNTTLSTTGTYYIAVKGYPHLGDAGGVAQNMTFATDGGAYQLVMGNVRNPNPPPAPPAPPTGPTNPVPPTPSPSAKHVPIEIRHWHQEERDLERRRGMSPITVVIMSMSGFDATTVDPSSLTFGATGSEKSLFRCRKEGVDFNRDGRADTVCYFKPDVANFQIGDRHGILKGKTKSGEQIEGSAALKIFSMPSQKRGFKRHDHDNDNGKK